MIDASTKNRLTVEFNRFGYDPIMVYLYGPDGDTDEHAAEVLKMRPELFEDKPFYKLMLAAYPPALTELKDRIQHILSTANMNEYNATLALMSRKENVEMFRSMMRSVGDTPEDIMSKLGLHAFRGEIWVNLSSLYAEEKAKLDREDKLRKRLDTKSRTDTHKIVEITVVAHSQLRAIAREMDKTNIDVLGMLIRMFHDDMFVPKEYRRED